MAAGEHPLVEQSIVPVVSDAADAASKPHVRPALFLRPRAGDGAAPPAPPGDPGLGPVLDRPHGIEAEFKGWAGVPRRWPEWVAKLRPRYEPLWREVGILDGILASTYRVRRCRDHEHTLLQLAAFWNDATGTFVFPWGEATLTLNDIALLAGLPLLGVPVRAPVSDSLEKDVAAIEAVRAVLNRSKKKKPSYSAWVERFVNRAPEEEAPPSATCGGGGHGDGEARELVEHGAFLTMWLSLFVFPGPPFDVVRRVVLPLAARLARGQSVALAPAALAAIYHDLSELKRRITSGKKEEPFVVSAPAHILQLWVWEHFTELSPEPAASSSRGDHDMPRAARWHEVGKRLSSKDVHAVFMSPKEFKWRPYGNRSLFGLQPERGGFWSTATSEALLSLVRCLRPCELVGMNCIQQYSPHRVARQLGFDQDIPGTVPRASSGWEKAWETYNIDGEISAFIFPKHKPGVTVQYAKWWKPYASACGSAIANAAKMKDGHDFVSPAKRKMEGALAGNSGKKLCLPVATSTRGRPPNIPAGINVYPSQSSGSHAAMSATVMPQPAPQGKCLQQSKDQDLSSANGENNSRQEHCDAVLLNVVQGAVNTVRSEAIGAGTEVDMLPTHEDLPVISDNDECDKSSSKAHEVLLKSHMSGAKMSLIRERNEDTKLVDARNDEIQRQVLRKVTKRGNFRDIIEISDDELDEETSKEAGVFVEATSKEDALSTMHLKSPQMEPAQTILQECNEQKQMVREINDEQDDLVMKEGTVQNSYDRQLASVLKKVSKQRKLRDIIEISDDELDEETSKEAGVFVERQQTDVLTPAANVQTNDGLLKGPTEEMDTCIVTRDIDNTDKVPNENFGSLNFSEKGNEDIFVTNQEYPMEHSAGASSKKSGNNERFSSRPLDGNTELVSQEVFDRMKDDANKLPRRAKIIELKKKINTLKDEIRALEATEEGKSPE